MQVDVLTCDVVVQVIFGGSEGALAGIQGVAGVVVSIDGLLLSEAGSAVVNGGNGGGDGDGDGEQKEMRGMVLQGLPFEGNVRIGKKSI